MAEDHCAQLIAEAFGEKTLYEILEVPRTAGDDEIKKAYRKLALKYHPDKGGDAKKFQALSQAHSILSDSEKRKVYDQTGSLEDEELSQDFTFWYEYFRGLFPKISVSDIESFSKKYIGSSEERSDVVAAYNEHDGDLKRIMEVVILAEEGDEHRICTVIDEAISAGELKATKKYLSSRVTKETSEKRKRKAEAKGAKTEESLEQLIRSRGSGRAGAPSAIQSIMEKYGSETGNNGGKSKGKSSTYDIADDEFEALQKKLTSKKVKT
jgi:DnaJ family protein C protein 9